MNPSGATAPQKRPDPKVIGFANRKLPWFQGVRRVTGNGMMSFRSRRKFSRFALAASVGMAVVIGCAGLGAHAADDEDEPLADVKIMRGILKGLGLRKDEAAIDYRERSPLVLPPGKELPSPEANAAAKAANWPDDPDVKRVKQKKNVERDRKAYVEGVDDRPSLPSDSDKAPAKGDKAGEAPGRSVD